MRYVLIAFLVVACSGEQKPTAPAGKAVDFDDMFDFFGAFENSEEEADETAEEEAETDSRREGPDLIVQSPSVSDSMLTPEQAFGITKATSRPWRRCYTTIAPTTRRLLPVTRKWVRTK